MTMKVTMTKHLASRSFNTEPKLCFATAVCDCSLQDILVEVANLKMVGMGSHLWLALAAAQVETH